jgi:hypothetical protein
MIRQFGLWTGVLLLSVGALASSHGESPPNT